MSTDKIGFPGSFFSNGIFHNKKIDLSQWNDGDLIKSDDQNGISSEFDFF